jgi:hypothetical protein
MQGNAFIEQVLGREEMDRSRASRQLAAQSICRNLAFSRRKRIQTARRVDSHHESLIRNRGQRRDRTAAAGLFRAA